MVAYKDIPSELKGVSANGTNYKFPFMQGNHATFGKLYSDKELRAAEDKELSYVFEGAFRAETEGWKQVRDNVVLPGYVRNPKRLVYLPTRKSNLPFEPAFEGGVIVQRDIKGEGVSTRNPYQNFQDGWVEKDGIFVNEKAEMSFVPASKYKEGEHTKDTFVKDGLVKVLLGGEESAEIFAKTAADNKRKPWLWALNCSEIQKEEQRVASLYGNIGLRLGVDALDGGSGQDGFVVGVFR